MLYLRPNKQSRTIFRKQRIIHKNIVLISIVFDRQEIVEWMQILLYLTSRSSDPTANHPRHRVLIDCTADNTTELIYTSRVDLSPKCVHFFFIEVGKESKTRRIIRSRQTNVGQKIGIEHKTKARIVLDVSAVDSSLRH